MLVEVPDPVFWMKKKINVKGYKEENKGEYM